MELHARREQKHSSIEREVPANAPRHFTIIPRDQPFHTTWTTIRVQFSRVPSAKQTVFHCQQGNKYGLSPPRPFFSHWLWKFSYWGRSARWWELGWMRRQERLFRWVQLALSPGPSIHASTTKMNRSKHSSFYFLLLRQLFRERQRNVRENELILERCSELIEGSAGVFGTLSQLHLLC